MSTIVTLDTGSLLKKFAKLNGTQISMRRGQDTNSGQGAHADQAGVYFFVASFIIMMSVLFIWALVVFIERQRLDRLKTRLNVSLN